MITTFEAAIVGEWNGSESSGAVKAYKPDASHGCTRQGTQPAPPPLAPSGDSTAEAGYNFAMAFELLKAAQVVRY